jgi:hypothetical protein
MKHLKNEIEIQVADENDVMQTYHLRYDLNALDAFEELYQKSILEIFQPSVNEDGQMMVDADGMPINLNFRVGMIRDLLWVGLKARHPEIGREEFGSMLDLEEASELLPKVTEALTISNRQRFPPEKLEDPKGGKRPKK